MGFDKKTMGKSLFLRVTANYSPCDRKQGVFLPSFHRLGAWIWEQWDSGVTDVTAKKQQSWGKYARV